MSISNHGALPNRRAVLKMSAALAALPLLGMTRQSARAAGEVRIGYQKGSATLLTLKAEGKIETALEPLGYTASWVEFSSGPPLLEALNAGSLDIGSTGAPPPLFAQAAGADLIYVLAAKPSPLTQAIIVPDASAIQAPADLKGKKVAVAKGSSAHALLLLALKQAALAWTDIEAVYLQPADAKAAFEGGSVEAWSIWDPYYAAEEAVTPVRTIANDETVKSPNRSFYLAARPFVTDHADALASVLEQLKLGDVWSDEHPDEAAALISEQTGIPEVTLKVVEDRRVYGLGPVTPEIVANQQALADLFTENGLLPKQIDVAAATLPQFATA